MPLMIERLPAPASLRIRAISVFSGEGTIHGSKSDYQEADSPQRHRDTEMGGMRKLVNATFGSITKRKILRAREKRAQDDNSK
jgi:hypothetical protein